MRDPTKAFEISRFPTGSMRRRANISQIERNVTIESSIMDAILVIGKKSVRFNMHENERTEKIQRLFFLSRSQRYTTIVGRIRAFSLLQEELNQLMFPRRWISAGLKAESK